MRTLDAGPDGHPWAARILGRLLGLTFDLSTPQGKLIAHLTSSLAEFEHDLLRERVKSEIAAVKARGQTSGRKPGYCPSHRHVPELVRLPETENLSQREIAARLGLSKTTVNGILRRLQREDRRLDRLQSRFGGAYEDLTGPLLYAHLAHLHGDGFRRGGSHPLGLRCR